MDSDDIDVRTTISDEKSAAKRNMPKLSLPTSNSLQERLESNI